MTKVAGLTKRAHYLAVYNQGRAWANDFVVLKAVPNGLSTTRCGFSVSKSLGKAVVRNRIKRLLREAVRLTSISPGWDVVFIARHPSVTANYRVIKEAVEEVLTRSHLMQNEL